MSLFRIAARVALTQPLSERYDYGTGPDDALPRGECDAAKCECDECDCESCEHAACPMLDQTF